MGGGGSGAPAPRSLYEETAGTLKAQVDLAPKLYAAEAQYRPQYTALELQGLENFLMGMPGGEKQLAYQDSVNGWRNRDTGEFSDTKPAIVDLAAKYPNSGRNGTRIVNPWEPYEKQITRYKNVKTEAQRGFLDLYANDIQPMSDQITAASLSRQRASDISDVANLGRFSQEALKMSNPEQTALMDTLNRQAREELDMGAHLDPSLARQVQQGYRQGQAARGLGMGRSDAAMESFMMGQQANQLRRERQQFATGMVGLNSSIYGDAFQNVLGRPALNLGQSNQMVGTAFGTNLNSRARLFDPVNSYAQDVYNSNFNAAAAGNIADKNGAAAQNAAMIGGGTAIVGASIIAL